MSTLKGIVVIILSTTDQHQVKALTNRESHYNINHNFSLTMFHLGLLNINTKSHYQSQVRAL